MPPKTKRKALADMLEDLSKVNFDKFCRQLLDRREEPRVRRSKVEGKNFLDIADLLVSTFTESRAVSVAETLLREIECYEEADTLVEDTGGQSSKPGGSTTSPSAGACGEDPMADGVHFVDKHRAQLIDRVCEVASILDELLDEKIIQQGSYDEILAIPTSRDKMRKLYCGPLNAAGRDGKDILLKILEKKERPLIDDLRRKK
ncbi:apoptosis-associated speck-like protein containing a CARD isoform X2 [Plectropomus leopardus]|uniref:apoptosis-associated speck-like protein containing a CARD isoform X2 n=1 Tax=Plectropomus leopardus TaxID=160734 RepID=UPI001C4CBA2F|nr:apoptosis-associated speck-like protein containing a CARD isoform X2 [Plectropomus leopardus]